MRARTLGISLVTAAAIGCAIEPAAKEGEDTDIPASAPAPDEAQASTATELLALVLPSFATNAAAASACFAKASAGAPKLCASCACGSCAAPAATCFESGDAAKDALCTAYARCALTNACVGDQCYCGKGLDTLTCLVSPKGPCVAEVEAAVGKKGAINVANARKAADPTSPFVRAEALSACSQAQCSVACAAPGTTCSVNDIACQDRFCVADSAREARRATAAQSPRVDPVVTSIAVGGLIVWRAGDGTRPRISPGQDVVVTGRGFGEGPDTDFTKVMIGQSRVLETDLRIFEQKLDIAKQVNYETSKVESSWNKDIVRWSDTEIAFRVPVHASKGPLVVQVQKRLPANESLLRPGEAHLVVDAQTLRITDASFAQTCDVVSGLDAPRTSLPIEVDVENAGFSDLVRRGREIFWGYDFNIGLAHAFRNLDWEKILQGRATDPVTGLPADPLALFGAYPANLTEVPDEAIVYINFDPYPQPNPIPGFLAIGQQKKAGRTRGTGYVGYRYAQSVHPFKGDGEWIGFNCASCHGYRMSYEKAPGVQVTRVVPGLPNPSWSMKWSLLGDFKGIKEDEEGPKWAPGKAAVDKTSILYAVPQGAGEHTLVRLHGEGSATDNDYEFAPIAIPNVTHHMPVRRSLSHTESYVGFEGSYIHSEEPDGALGSMRAESLQALTAYMTTLDGTDDELRRVGLYRWLKDEGTLGRDVGAASEGTFVAAGWDTFPALKSRLARGAAIYGARCASCHTDGLGANTNERMVRLDEVGRFFEPTVYQKETQSVRVTFLRDLYWTQHRGLLSDGHVKNLTDLVSPDRCTVGSSLYNAYYTLHAPTDPGRSGPDFPVTYPATGRRGDVFRVERAASTNADDAGAKKNRFVERFRYFTTRADDPAHYYWDFQKMRAEYGPAELGTAKPIGLPATPHPWCAGSADEVQDLVAFLLTL